MSTSFKQLKLSPGQWPLHANFVRSVVHWILFQTLKVRSHFTSFMVDWICAFAIVSTPKCKQNVYRWYSRFSVLLLILSFASLVQKSFVSQKVLSLSDKLDSSCLYLTEMCMWWTVYNRLDGLALSGVFDQGLTTLVKNSQFLPRFPAATLFFC